MKKRIVIIACLLILCLSLFSCAENTDNNSKEALNTKPNAAAVGVDLEETSEEEIPVYGDFDGFLWEVKGPESTVYLFGSIHMADKSLYPFSEQVEKAFESADHLGVEADVTDMGAALAMQDQMIYQEGDIYAHLSEEGLEKYNAAFEELGMKPDLFSKFRVWVAGSNIMSMQLMKSEYSATSGVDMYFTNKASKMNKDIIELEGIGFQFELMNSFTDLQQEALFITPLGSIEETISEFDELYSLYLAGEEAPMMAYLFSEDSDLTSDPAIERAMLQDRNKAMAEKIDAMLQTEDDYFIVVGLAHYLGEESVVDYLEQMGYTVERK